MVYYISCVRENSMREWLSWWSATLPRSRPRVRVPSRALEKVKGRYESIGLFAFSRIRDDWRKAARQPPRRIPLPTVFGGGWNEMRMHFVCSTVLSMRSGSRTRAQSRAKFVCIQLYTAIIQIIWCKRRLISNHVSCLKNWDSICFLRFLCAFDERIETSVNIACEGAEGLQSKNLWFFIVFL